MQRRIKRNYRQMNPAKFLAFLLTVRRSLTNNRNYPDTFWGTNLALLQLFFEKTDAYEVAFRAASNGDRVLIHDRDKIMGEIVVILDQIVPLLEGGSVLNPDALSTTGFPVTHERRAHNRTKSPLTSSNDFNVENLGELGKALGSASTVPGAYNHEIHINRGDPSREADWFHHSMFPDASRMLMENLQAGNTFFRMRHHGADGPGPWSPVTSVTIS
ncbi:hypothetical protein KP004_08065 [Geomonas oryzisoli]|uniref:Uncharacterized protein n=1 Tax=Geomonas oryzisoli TaxID=2847992 RepID=A0ABX8J9U3_9BACT|nr:hypothetical protein [Geomonas oryzisoli]QWV95120.1 hypothetical protein KP004_08065 [Geomonas oryzisoli]